MVRPEHQDTNINSKYHKVMAWLSPSFPVGAFAYSHGLEFEISVGNISRSDDLYNWLSDILQYGSVWNDLILFCEEMTHLLYQKNKSVELHHKIREIK